MDGNTKMLGNTGISLTNQPAFAGGGVAAWTWDTEHTADANTINLYHLEDNAASTAVADSSGNAYDGVATANTNTLSAAGKFNLGFNFNDVSNVDINSNAMDTKIITACTAGNFTMECWIKSNDADWSVNGTQFFYYIRDNDNIEVRLYYSSTADTIRAEYGIERAEDATGVDTTNWIHIALTINSGATELKLFINGVQKGGTQTGFTWPFTGATAIVRISGDNLGANPADVIIDEAAMSDVLRYS